MSGPRPGGDRRGNCYARRRRRIWLLATFDPELGPDKAYCHLWDIAGDGRCKGLVDLRTLTVDRIDPGGPYRRDNIQPACVPCQNYQGALITREKRIAWLTYRAQADAEGIEWDGVM